MHIEDAQRVLIRWLRKKPASTYPNYGYDICLSNVIIWHAQEAGRREDATQAIPMLWPTFVAAAWELCRRGILRPGVRRLHDQSTEQGNAGEGYSITPFGEQWIAESDRDDFVPTEPQRFAQMLAPFKGFGPGFLERAQEAVRCYGAHAYLACCALCGAEAESLLLAAAIK